MEKGKELARREDFVPFQATPDENISEFGVYVQSKLAMKKRQIKKRLHDIAKEFDSGGIDIDASIAEIINLTVPYVGMAFIIDLITEEMG